MTAEFAATSVRTDQDGAGDGRCCSERNVVEMFSAKVDRLDLKAAVAQIASWARNPACRPRVVTVTGFHGLWVAQQDPSFLAILNRADLFCADGIAPVWMARLLGRPLPGRVPGPDLLAAFLERADSEGMSSFFFGDRDQTLIALRKRLERNYPGHRIAGMFSPPFRPPTASEDEAHIRLINEAKADVLWVGLGLPKQERWIEAHRDRLEVPVVVGVGAAFGFLSGMVRRAPRWVGDLGFEWAWRLAAEPKKLWRRDLVDGPRFLYRAVSEVLRRKR